MNSIMKKSALGLLIIGITSTSVFAGERENKTAHSDKPSVMERVKKEELKNEQALKSGKITEAQANKLNQEDESVRKEAEEDARKNGGKLSGDEKRELNKKENKINQQRARMEKRNAAQPKSPAPVAPAQVNPS